MNQTLIARRTFLARSLALTLGVGLLAACTSAAPATPAAAPISKTASVDDVQTAFDGFVKKELPGVPIELLQAAKGEANLTAYLAAPVSDKTLATQFQNTFPFVNLQYTQAAGGTVVGKFMSESQGGQAIADIVQASALGDAQNANASNFLMAYTASTEADFNMSLGIPGKAYPMYGEVLNIAYNPNRIDDTAARSFTTWKGLLDPQWNGKKFGLVAVMAGGTPQLLNYYFYKTFGATLWQRIQQSGYQIFPGNNQVMDALVSGEVDIGVGTVESITSVVWGSGAPIHWVNAQDWLVSPSEQIISVRAPHPNAAKLFQEFTLSATAQSIFGQGGQVSYRKGMTITAPFSSQPWYVDPQPSQYWSYSPADVAAQIQGIATQYNAIFS